MPDTLITTQKSTGLNWLRIIGIIVAALGAMVPLILPDSPFILVLASHAVIAAIVAVSLDMLTGNTGLLSFGHAGWFGLGAYTAGLLSQALTTEMLVIVPMAIVLAILLSWAVGQILVRQIGKAFAILTLAFSQVLYALVFVFSSYTGGEDGLQGVPVPTLLGFDVTEPKVWYWLLYVSLLASLYLALHIRRTPLGKAWLGIRENTERAYFIGLNVNLLKLLSYIFSSAMAAFAGSLFVLFNGATSPEILHWFESGKILMYVVLGGIGTIVGPALGAVVFTFAEHYISSYTDAWLIYFGALFVLIVIVAPGGIFGLLRPVWERLTQRNERGAP
ncbi:branched-chain amino acid ABC transporter permease [Pollutimonas bauzanensis]|uniref:branched-chain amino acid ABC transporter permease n=1 Tax=Pollutimonas bauzanensis TaxID=658167 RepID=UPI00333F1A17